MMEDEMNMKKMNSKFATVIFVLSILLSIPAFAYSDIDYRASEQIMSYYINTTAAGDGEIAISVSIDGTGKMTRIGAKRIVIYNKINNVWALADSMSQNDPGMSSSNAYFHSNTIFYSGKSGTEYKIEVTVFAQDSSGSDSRTQTFYVTA